MRPFEREWTFIMLPDSKTGFEKTFNRMTLRTIGRNTLPGKLATMVILMTASATVKF